MATETTKNQKNGKICETCALQILWLSVYEELRLGNVNN